MRWFAEQGAALIAQYRDEAEGLIHHRSHAEEDRKRGLADLSNQARRTAWELNRLACDLADAAGGLPPLPMRHYEELLAEVRAGEHEEVA